jgi:Secretion system C-terminal sorting domain
MKKSFLPLLALALLANQLFAQTAPQHVCGITPEDSEVLVARMLENRKNPAVKERGAITYIPLHFHLVASSLGVGRHREWNVLDQLCELNDEYKPHDIQFYLSEHPNKGNVLFNKTINLDAVYTTQTNVFAMQQNRHPRAINIFVSNVASSGNNGPGTTLAYYSPSQDWIVSKKDQVNGSGNGTLPHELGHFFSLPHTFRGWDFESFGPTSPTWPKAPATSPTGVATEKADGSNCATAGDMICDTPADLNFGFISNGCAPYNGGALDPMGTPYNPMENNTMGYFQNCNDYEFTPMQATNMVNDIASSDRNYLDNTFVPKSTSLLLPSNFIVGPIQNEVTTTYDAVDLIWNTVPDATNYIVEVDKVPSFASTTIQTLILGNVTTTRVKLEANKTFYWRIRPFNVHSACIVSPPVAFKTSSTSALNDLPSVASAEVAPNPITGDAAQLLINATESFEMSLRLTDATGRTIYTQNQVDIAAGEQVIPIEVSNLANGAYFLSLTVGNRTETKLVTIVR